MINCNWCSALRKGLTVPELVSCSYGGSMVVVSEETVQFM